MSADSVAAILDQQAIRDVLSRYCEYIDEFNLVAVEALFTEDCTTDYGPGRGGLIIGPRAFRMRIENNPNGHRHTHHQLGQIRIELMGNEARSIAYGTADHEFHDGRRETVRLQYRDHLVKTVTGWRIAHRQMLATIIDGDTGVARAWLPRNDRRGL